MADRRGLTDRQLQILRLCGSGAPHKRLALELGIAPGTVRGHLERIYLVLKVHHQTAALVKVLSQGYIYLFDLPRWDGNAFVLDWHDIPQRQRGGWKWTIAKSSRVG